MLSSRSVATSNNSFNNVPLGVITFTGTLRQFMSEYSRATDTYIIERANGDWSAINPRSAAARGTEAISGDRFHIVKPLSEDYPRVGGVRNAAVTEVRAVTAQAEEDFFSVLETVAAGGTFSQTFVVDDDSIISISNWRAEKINDSQTDLTVTISGSGKTVTVTLQNTTGASIDAGYQIKGTPSRISTIRQFSITRPTSITQFGRKEDDIPNWLASTGLPSLNQRLNRIQQPLHFIRAKIPIWQNGKTQTTAIAAIRAGAIHRFILNISPTGDPGYEGAESVALNVLVMSARYSWNGIGRIPYVEFDLLEFPQDYSGLKWDLNKEEQSKLGRTTIFS